MCINNHAKKFARKEQIPLLKVCHLYCKANKCDYDGEYKYLNYIKTKNLRDKEAIESMKEYGKECKTCPYKASIEKRKLSNIIFVPYNYLLN